jgi:hypothetical protein
LRPDGRAAVSVNTVPERSFNIRINIAIARYMPSLRRLRRCRLRNENSAGVCDRLRNSLKEDVILRALNVRSWGRTGHAGMAGMTWMNPQRSLGRIQ